jgi:polar amino acid transport system substrate-binding protein
MEHFPPFNMDENGVATGPLPDIVRAACAVMQADCTFQTFPWRRAYRLAELGMVSGIFVLQRLAERENDFYFTDPVIQTSFSVFVQTSSGFNYSNPRELDHHTIGVYGPSATSKAAEEILQAASGAELVLETGNETVFKKLANGRYGEHGVAVMNTDVGNYLLRQANIGGIRYAGEIKKIEYAIGLSKLKHDQMQFEQFNNAIRELKRNGTIKAIVEKYGMTAPK